MNKHIEQIRQRRDLLVIRSELQRFDLALQIEPWKKPMGYIDRGVALARRAREHPTLVATVLAALAFVVRKRFGRVARLGWSAWGVYRLFVKK